MTLFGQYYSKRAFSCSCLVIGINDMSSHDFSLHNFCLERSSRNNGFGASQSVYSSILIGPYSNYEVHRAYGISYYNNNIVRFHDLAR